MKTNAHLTTLPVPMSSAIGPEPQDNLNPHPAVAGFLAARDRLRRRELELTAEIAEIRKLLSGASESLESSQPVPVSPTPAAPPVARSSAPPKRSNAGLGQKVIDLITQHGPLTKDQLVEFLLAEKFPFFGKPKPALDPVLYGKKFQRNGKVFALAGSPANSIPMPPA